MDEISINILGSSKDEWVARLLYILTPLMIKGIKSIYEEAYNTCKKNNEKTKYLMVFQKLISAVPKWNEMIVKNETARIIKESKCPYLEDMLSCVHIIQLKLLSGMRVGKKQKKIDITIMKIDEFIHKAYINISRELYKNAYLFQYDVDNLQCQKNNREIENIVKEEILKTIRCSIPVEPILKAYLDETVEEDVEEEIIENVVEQKIDDKVLKEEVEKLKKEEDEKIKVAEQQRKEYEEQQRKIEEEKRIRNEEEMKKEEKLAIEIENERMKNIENENSTVKFNKEIEMDDDYTVTTYDDSVEDIKIKLIDDDNVSVDSLKIETIGGDDEKLNLNVVEI